MLFCKERASDGPTEEDAILRDFNSAAFSEGEEVREEQDIQNQVEMCTLQPLQNTQHNFRAYKKYSLNTN